MTRHKYIPILRIILPAILAQHALSTHAATVTNSELESYGTSTTGVSLNTGNTDFVIDNYTPGWAVSGSTNTIYLGANASSNGSTSYNNLTISGQNSRLFKQAMAIGFAKAAASTAQTSNYNKVVVTNGATVDLSQILTIGSAVSGTNKTASYNSLVISDSGKVSALQLNIASTYNYTFESNKAEVTGLGSILTITTSVNIGYGAKTINNTLTLSDEGLLILGTEASAGTISLKGESNLLRFDGGYLAWYGDESVVSTAFTTLLATSNVQVADGDSWVTASLSDFTFTAGTADLYAGVDLSGYTLIALSAVPEPAAYAALAGGSLLGYALWRRRRQTSVVS